MSYYMFNHIYEHILGQYLDFFNQKRSLIQVSNLIFLMQKELKRHIVGQTKEIVMQNHRNQVTLMMLYNIDWLR